MRPYLSQDMYPLTEPSAKLDVWMAAQYHRPSQGDGLIQVFRRERSPYETARFKLCGLEEEAEYRIEDMDDGSWVKAAGSQLMRGGFELTIEKPRTAKLFIYTKI